ncbi:MAG: hypothetical protein AABY07_01390 [Nanoarchaeota archaeon]
MKTNELDELVRAFFLLLNDPELPYHDDGNGNTCWCDDCELIRNVSWRLKDHDK